MADFQMLRLMPVSLRRYLPSFLYADERFTAMQGALEIEHERQRLDAIDVAKQFFISTATWGLDDWEEFAGLETNHALDYATRRKAIYVKLNGTQTVTLEFLTELVNLFVATKTGIVIDHPEGYFLDVLLPDGQVTSFEQLEKSLDLYVPAHIGWKYIGYAKVTGKIYVGGVVSSHFRTEILADTAIEMHVPELVSTVAGVITSGAVTTIPAEQYR